MNIDPAVLDKLLRTVGHKTGGNCKCALCSVPSSPSAVADSSNGASSSSAAGTSRASSSSKATLPADCVGDESTPKKLTAEVLPVTSAVFGPKEPPHPAVLPVLSSDSDQGPEDRHIVRKKVSSILLIGNRRRRAEVLKRTVHNELLGLPDNRKRKADHTKVRDSAERLGPCIRTHNRTPISAPRPSQRRSEPDRTSVERVEQFRTIPLDLPEGSSTAEDPRQYIRREEVLQKYLRKSEVERNYVKKSDLKKAGELALAAFCRYLDYCE